MTFNNVTNLVAVATVLLTFMVVNLRFYGFTAIKVSTKSVKVSGKRWQMSIKLVESAKLVKIIKTL